MLCSGDQGVLRMTEYEARAIHYLYETDKSLKELLQVMRGSQQGLPADETHVDRRPAQ